MGHSRQAQIQWPVGINQLAAGVRAPSPGGVELFRDWLANVRRVSMRNSVELIIDRQDDDVPGALVPCAFVWVLTLQSGDFRSSRRLYPDSGLEASAPDKADGGGVPLA